MKKTIICVMFILALALCSVSVSAEELYPTYPKAWMNRNSHGQALLKYTDYNLSGYYSGISVSTASGRWAVTANSYQRVVVSAAASNESYRVYHVASLPDFWKNKVGEYWMNDAAAVTFPYGSNGSELTQQSSSPDIKGANVYYPDTTYGDGTTGMWEDNAFASLSTAVKNNVICHETGHALGFGHVSSGTSVMREVPANMSSSLSASDKTNLAAKYPYS
jgi:hypothetical protein